MGSSAYNLLELPEEIKVMINEAILRNNVIVVGEAHGLVECFKIT